MKSKLSKLIKPLLLVFFAIYFCNNIDAAFDNTFNHTNKKEFTQKLQLKAGKGIHIANGFTKLFNFSFYTNTSKKIIFEFKNQFTVLHFFYSIKVCFKNRTPKTSIILSCC